MLVLDSVCDHLRIHKVEVAKRVPFDSSAQLWLDPSLLVHLVGVHYLHRYLALNSAVKANKLILVVILFGQVLHLR